METTFRGSNLIQPATIVLNKPGFAEASHCIRFKTFRYHIDPVKIQLDERRVYAGFYTSVVRRVRELEIWWKRK